jgi:hypothetical protein
MATNILAASFAGLTFLITGCGQPAVHPDETAAVAAILKLGGKVEYAPDADRRVVKVYLHDTPVRDADLAVLEKLPKLKNLFLGRTQIGDAGLEHLKNAAQLETLSLNGTGVTDAGLKSLIELKNLKTLNLQETRVTNGGVALLRKSLRGATIAR